MIDINDFIIKRVGANRAKYKFFRIYCNNCGSDRGYLQKSQDKRPTCNKCAKLGNKAGIETREKMSKSALGNKNATLKYRNTIRSSEDQQKVDGRFTRCLSTYARDYGNSKEHNRLRHATRTLLNQKLKRRFIKKDISTCLALGYSIKDLKKHLESKFQPGMTWENHGEWHIDHIVPDSTFNYDSIHHLDFKKSWALENLQPLWAKDNMSKSNKIVETL